MTRAIDPTPSSIPSRPSSSPARTTDYRREPPRHFTAPRALLWPAVILLAAAAGLFFWTLGRMWERWNDLHGYYSHGPLIFPIAVGTAFLIIRRRGLPMHSTPSSRATALGLLVAALLMHLLSIYARVTFVSGFMIIPLLAAITLYLGGWPMLQRLWFPIAFLAFMVPLPDLAIGDINFRLKMFAAGAATGIVNGLGTPAYLRGAEIFLQKNRSLTVED